MEKETQLVDLSLKNILNKHHNFIISVIDTDSLTINKPDGGEFSTEEIETLTKEINHISEELIRWEFEFYIPKLIVVKSKNYILFDGTRIKTKGSSLRDQKREIALKEMIECIIDNLVYENESFTDIYHKYIKEAMNPQNVRRWCQKKSVSESVLNCKGYEDLADEDEDSPRKNESDVWDAIKDEEGIQQGDKIYVYPVYLGKKSYEEKKYKKNKETGEKDFVGYLTKEKDVYGLRLDKYYKNDIATDKLVKRVYDTMKIFESVIDITQFPKYHNKSNKELLEKLINE